MRTINITFPVDVELPDALERRLVEIVDEVCRAYEKAHPDRTMWAAGFGALPQWSQADAAFLGKTAAPNAPESGEPTFDDSVYNIDVAERERYEGEKQ